MRTIWSQGCHSSQCSGSSQQPSTLQFFLPTPNQVNQSTKSSLHLPNRNLHFWYKILGNASYGKQDIKLEKYYHDMFRTGSHTPEEAAHTLILLIRMVQVPFAMITRFLHSGRTSHVSWNCSSYQKHIQLKRRLCSAAHQLISSIKKNLNATSKIQFAL